MVEYVGFDVSKEATAFLRDGCGREGFGARAKVASAPKAPFEVLREPCLCPERIVLETGTLSFWLARGLGKRGLPVDVIDARPGRTRQMKLQHNKTASGRRLELLAEIARTGFCRDPRRPEPVRQTARGGGLSGADDAGAIGPGRWTPRGAYPSTATPWCAACSTRPPTPCSRVVRKAHPLKAHPLKAHPLKDWARPGSGSAAATRRPAWRWRKLAVILQRMLTTGAPFRWPEKKEAARA